MWYLCREMETPMFTEVEDAARTHVPELEQAAYNQMPKNSWTELKLYRFDGTDLYQWFGREKMRDTPGEHYYVWQDSASEVFVIRQR